MILGKWNKSVILTYVGIGFALAGIYYAMSQAIHTAMSCLIIAGICDLFDGFIARRIARSDSEKQFGIALDTLADAINFISLPVVIMLALGYQTKSDMALLIGFAICAIARLSHFTQMAFSELENNTHYQGLPVTYIALIMPLVYLAQHFSKLNLLPWTLLIVALLEVSTFKIAKPRGFAYLFFSMLAIAVLVTYQVL